jgi:hypothetical protein
MGRRTTKVSKNNKGVKEQQRCQEEQQRCQEPFMGWKNNKGVRNLLWVGTFYEFCRRGFRVNTSSVRHSLTYFHFVVEHQWRSYLAIDV